MPMTSLYSGSGAYCYANSLHMCLGAAGFDAVPGPGFLECLTTMPFGAGYIRLEQGALPLLSPVTVDPDAGLTRALAALGWTCQEGQGGDEAEALDRLREGLMHGPVVLGPLDMGYLSYHPDCAHQPDADHHIAVLALEDDHALVHDPDGYPYAVLPLADLLTSWRADSIDWKRGAYRMRYAFRQQHPRSRGDMIRRTLPLAVCRREAHQPCFLHRERAKACLGTAVRPRNAPLTHYLSAKLGLSDRLLVRENLLADPGGPVEYGGVRALRLLAGDLRGEVSPRLHGGLVHFLLPLAARRFLDGALFFAEARLPEAAAILDRQAHLCGEAQILALQKRYGEVARRIDEVAECDIAITELLGAAIVVYSA